MFTSDVIHPTLLKACQYLVSHRSVNNEKNVDEYVDNSKIDDDDKFLSMFIDEDLYVDDEDEEEIKEKPKKKKKVKVELSEEELAEKKRVKEERKARKEALKEAQLEAERIHRIQKEERKAAERKREAEAAIIELVTRKEYLINKLDTINIKKKKNASKISEMKIELKDIDIEINRLKNEFNIYVEDTEDESKIKRGFRRFKSKMSRAGKKIKKFFNKNSELILGLSSVILPVFAGMITKTVIK